MSYIKKTINGIEQEYWVKDDLDKTKAIWRIAFSQRGPGKSYQIKCEAIDRWLETGKQFGMMRRLDNELTIDKVSEYWSDMTDYFTEKAKAVFPNFESFVIIPRAGKWTVYGMEEGSSNKEPLGVIGYYFAINCSQRYKSVSYPDIDFVVVEEFMSESHQYLPNEFDKILSIISTIKRRRTDFVIYMLGNTVDMNCPILHDMNINCREMAQGDIKLFTYYGGNNGTVKNTVAVEYIRKVEQNDDSEAAFIFNRQQENMIINGAWQTGDYPLFNNDDFYSNVRPKLSVVIDYVNIKLYLYFDKNKDGLPIMYVSNERLGNRFKYIFITSKTYINRNQFSYNSDLPIVKNIKNLIMNCINNNNVFYNSNYSGSDMDDCIRNLF